MTRTKWRDNIKTRTFWRVKILIDRLTLYCITNLGGSAMLAEEIEKLEYENAKLRELLKLQQEDIPKPKQCKNCKYFRQHYSRTEYGNYFKLYMGHCICGVPTGKRKGKKNPTPEDTCICFQENI